MIFIATANTKIRFIEEVPTQSRPRERLIYFGEKALADHELLAILLRTGTKQENVMQLSYKLIQQFESLYGLHHASLSELQKVSGIGKIKAIELKAMMEIGLRIATSTIPKFGKIHTSDDVGEWLLKEMRHYHQEYLTALFLNTKNEIIRKKDIFIGTVNSSVAHPREIFKEAVKYPTARLIIGHNHPSGDPEPSKADLQFTKRMIECGELMGIELLDHIIVGQDVFISLRTVTDLF